jgi:hypothetical protein
VNGDGFADIITAPGAGGGPHVRVFSGADGSVLREFFAFSVDFRAGVFVAAGDVNGDGFADIIAGVGPGGGSEVRVINGATGRTLADFQAFPTTTTVGYTGDTQFFSGARVAALDANGDGNIDIVVLPGPGTTPRGRAFNGTGALLTSFLAFESFFLGGVYVG